MAPGVCDDGLRMTALPAASAIGRIHIGTMTGKLNGVIAATTPSGWRSVTASTPVATLGVFMPARWTGRPHAYSTVSMPRVTPTRASGKVLPWSRVTSAASSSRCFQASSRKAKNTWLRTMSGRSRQAGKARLRGRHRAVDLGLAAARHARDDLAGGRVVDGAGLLGQDLDRPPADPVAAGWAAAPAPSSGLIASMVTS